MAPSGRPRGRPRKSTSSAASSTRISDPLTSFPAPPLGTAPSFVDSAYGSQSQSQSQGLYDTIHYEKPAQRVPLKPTSPVQSRTPIHKQASPGKAAPVRMTAAQKQALIDNLRLENRARRLRAQYNQSAASLKRRLEMRIHRVPAALRKLTMGEVIERHEQKVHAEAEAKARRAREAEEEEEEKRQVELAAQKKEAEAKARENVAKKGKEVTKTRAKKRTSDEMEHEDKENETLPNKRARPAATTSSTATTNKPATKASRSHAPPQPPSRATNRPTATREVLSPKSHNTRLAPPTPSKFSPSKPLSRPTSPLKLSAYKPSTQVSPTRPVTIPSQVPGVAGVGTASSMAKLRGHAPASNSKAGTTVSQRTRGSNASRDSKGSRSEGSSISNSTTVVTKSKPQTAKGKVVGTVKAVASKTVGKGTVGKGTAGKASGKNAAAVATKTAGAKAAAGGVKSTAMGVTARGTVGKNAAAAKGAAVGDTGGGRTLRRRG
ncbi:MAG: hypothetical protein Q9162_004455 [Coniocarpon cinnabarinum]